MRIICLFILSFLLPYFSFAATQPIASANTSALDQLSGTWDTLPEGEELCKKNDFFHTITVSADRQRVTFQHEKPIDGPSGKLAQYSYKVLYSDAKSITMFMEGETRKLQTGDLAIWNLILDGSDKYRWRIYGTPPEWRNSVVGKRCKP